jgi:hypothetical protein
MDMKFVEVSKEKQKRIEVGMKSSEKKLKSRMYWLKCKKNDYSGLAQ